MSRAGAEPRPDRLNKGAALRHWLDLPDNAPLNPAPIPYKHKGSTYSADGIRITGSKSFIDGVLSRLKPLLRHENALTRLSLNYQESTDKESRTPTGQWCCYVQVHQRGRESAMASAVFGGIYDRELNRKPGESLELAREQWAGE